MANLARRKIKGKKENYITSSLNPPPMGSKNEKILFSKCFFLDRNDTFDDIPKTDVPMTPAPQKTTPHTQPKTPTPQKSTPKKKKKGKKERKKEREREREAHTEEKRTKEN